MVYYDFMCNACGHIFESHAKYEEKAAECPHCETRTAYRLPSLTAPPRGSFGTVSRRPSKASTKVRDEQLSFEFMKDKESKE